MAVGVKGKWTSRNSHGGVEGPITDKTVREVIIKAKKVVVSCGTLWSPVILLNSGLTVCQIAEPISICPPPLQKSADWSYKNRHIGRNLYLHPVNFVAAVFKEDVKPWEGESSPRPISLPDP
jgi:GMC oxidoreductase